jgi:uncharacterized protein (DUF924 family)
MTDIRDDVSPAVLLAFWLAAGSDHWYKRNDAFDAVSLAVSARPNIVPAACPV